jgi:hypothetical protein
LQKQTNRAVEAAQQNFILHQNPILRKKLKKKVIFKKMLLTHIVPLSEGGYKQGDQIGRIFAYWVIVFFELFFLNYVCTEGAYDFGATFLSRRKYILSFDKKGVATFWVTFHKLIWPPCL